MATDHPDLTAYDPSTHTPTDLMSYISGNLSGIQIDPESVSFVAPEGSSSLFESISLGSIGAQSFNFAQRGILLTSGDGTPAASNTQGYYTVQNSGPGDDALDVIAQQAFSGAGQTRDAAVLEFSFTVTDPQVKGIGFDVMFGSEEYPVYINSSFVDIAAITVNGTNIAFIDGDVSKPLSIVGATVEDGRFFANGTSADSGSTEPSPLAIEYNGVTPKLFIPVGLTPEVSHYTVRIGIADTGDYSLDSGLFVSNFRATESGVSTPLVMVEAAPEGSALEPAAPTTPTYFKGGTGNDTMTGGLGADFYDVTTGGFNTIQGALEQLDKDTVVGFTSNDVLKVLGSFFNQDQLTVTKGSAILDIDTDGDSESDGTITLEGEFNGAFLVSVDESGSIITYDPGVGRPDNYGVAERVMEIYSSVWGAAPDPEGLDYWVSQIEAGNLTYVDTVRSFFDQPLVQERYADTSGDALLLALYQTIFRIAEPDEAGLAYWRDLINEDPTLLGENVGSLVMQMIDGMWANDHVLAMNAQSLFQNFVSTSSAFIFQLKAGDLPSFSQMTESQQDVFLSAARDLTTNLAAGSTSIDMEGMVTTAMNQIAQAAGSASTQSAALWMGSSWGLNSTDTNDAQELLPAGMESAADDITLVGTSGEDFAIA